LYRIEAQSTRQVVALVVMVLAFLLYYGGWARYFMRGRSHALLFEPFLGLPLPLAISPIVYFLAASLLFGSWYLSLATMVLAAGHLWITFHGAGQAPGRPLRRQCGRVTPGERAEDTIARCVNKGRLV
jgi:hypothetical protein